MNPSTFITIYPIGFGSNVENSHNYPAMLQSIASEDISETAQAPIYNGLDLDDVEQNRELFKAHKNAAVDIVRTREREATKAEKRLKSELNRKQKSL